MLAVAVAAVLAGAKSLAAIGEWAADAPGPVLAALGSASTHPAATANPGGVAAGDRGRR
jgi:hypothetical protein